MKDIISDSSGVSLLNLVDGNCRFGINDTRTPFYPICANGWITGPMSCNSTLVFPDDSILPKLVQTDHQQSDNDPNGIHRLTFIGNFPKVNICPLIV